MKAGREVTTAKGKAYREILIAIFETDWGKTEARIEIGQEQSSAEIETDLEEVEATNLDANPGKTKVVVERQEIPNEEAAVHPVRAWWKETVACQETTKARLGCKEPTSEDKEYEVERR
jgi:hypothetical protein